MLLSMDNFRKPNRSKLTGKKTSFIDGIVTSQAGGRSGENTVRRPVATAGVIGDFKQIDGFHPTRQDVIQQPMLGRQPRRTESGAIALDMSTIDTSSVHEKKRRTKKPRSKKKIALLSALGVFVCLLGIAGFLFAKGYIKLHKVFQGGSGGAPALNQDVNPIKLKGEGDGRINILMLGKGGEGHAGADLTDTLLIASIDPVHKEAALLSIPRDLYVKTASSGSMKINSVYATAKNKVLAEKNTNDRAKRAEEAGLKAIEAKISEVTGLPIHYHAMVDFEGFRKAIDTVGGIDVTVKTALYEVQWLADQRKNYVLNVKPGVEHFDGVRALAYARSRHVSPRGDFDRAERQRAILVALKDKVFAAGTYSNPIKISQLLDAFGDHIQTNLSIDEMRALYTIGKDITGTKIASVGLADPPNNYVKTDNINGLSVVVPRLGLYDYTEIQNYLRNSMRDGFLKKEDASLMVLNGTTVAGLATKKATDLRSYGYTVSKVGDAPTKNYPTTILVDLTNGAKKYTKNYLEKRLGVTAVTTVPDSTIQTTGADFVIILGQNETTTN
jgi:polyisoprenyl-teichoic acid--peptidoglycan teichoic acid transferase